MAINTNNNTYTIVYASIVVIVVAFLLAFVSKVLEPQSKANERIDKKKQIFPLIKYSILFIKYYIRIYFQKDKEITT